MLAELLVLVFGLAISGLFFWVGSRPTVTPREQYNLIHYGTKEGIDHKERVAPSTDSIEH